MTRPDKGGLEDEATPGNVQFWEILEREHKCCLNQQVICILEIYIYISPVVVSTYYGTQRLRLSLQATTIPTTILYSIPIL